MTADLRQDLVLLLAAHDHERPQDLADRILELVGSPTGWDPEWAHRLTQAIDAERSLTDEWLPVPDQRVAAARKVTDALVQEGPR